jgi:ubiquinone/menaquinone biosynthesis C-methylase UbiE
MDAKTHWEHVYQAKGPEQLSWFQAEATLSRELIAQLAPARASRVIDVGAGASTLVDGLLADGYSHVTVLDLTVAALDVARARLGADAKRVEWLEGDVLTAPLPAASADVWHDRAVFHFLTDPLDRARYVEQVRRVVRPQGTVLVATFADDGPTRCSGLEVRRYSPSELHNEFGRDFRLRESRREEHHTPWGTLQAFTYCVCSYEPAGDVRSAA